MSTKRPYTRTAHGTGLNMDAVQLPWTAAHAGLFFHFGGGFTLNGWTNPVPGKVTATSSEALIIGTIDLLTNRESSDVATPDTPLSWYRWDFPVPVQPTAFDVRHRNFSPESNLAGACKVQGSNDYGSSWTDLWSGTFTGSRDAWETAYTVTASTWYRSLRIIQTGTTRTQGDDYFCLGEVEFYGWVL